MDWGMGDQGSGNGERGRVRAGCERAFGERAGPPTRRCAYGVRHPPDAVRTGCGTRAESPSPKYNTATAASSCSASASNTAPSRGARLSSFSTRSTYRRCRRKRFLGVQSGWGGHLARLRTAPCWGAWASGPCVRLGNVAQPPSAVSVASTIRLWGRRTDTAEGGCATN